MSCFKQFGIVKKSNPFFSCAVQLFILSLLLVRDCQKCGQRHLMCHSLVALEPMHNRPAQPMRQIGSGRMEEVRLKGNC